MEPILELCNLTKTFGGLTAVDDINFSLQQGQIFGLIGPNGAGKTTIFNMITGFYPPSRGTVTFRGKCIASPGPSWIRRLFRREALPKGEFPVTSTRLRPHQITELGIARTFQTIRLFKNLTALENVMSGLHHRTHAGVWAALARSSAQRDEEEFIQTESERLLSFMGLQAYRSELAKNLPYGDQRRLEIARALAANPSLVILDEPAAGLNELETMSLVALIRQIQGMGITILLIEHDMKLVMGICERIVVIDHGRKIAEGAPAEVQAHPDVIDAYLGMEESEA